MWRNPPRKCLGLPGQLHRGCGIMHGVASLVCVRASHDSEDHPLSCPVIRDRHGESRARRGVVSPGTKNCGTSKNHPYPDFYDGIRGSSKKRGRRTPRCFFDGRGPCRPPPAARVSHGNVDLGRQGMGNLDRQVTASGKNTIFSQDYYAVKSHCVPIIAPWLDLPKPSRRTPRGGLQLPDVPRRAP